MRTEAAAPPAASGEAAPSGRFRLSRHWRTAIILVLVTRGAFFVVSMVATWLLSGGTGTVTDGFLTIWSRWDARLLLLVAEHGYTAPATDPHATAFFPAFPLLVRALGGLGLNLVLAGLVVSTVSTVVATVYLHRLAEEELGEGAGRRAALYLLLFPTAVFLIAPYSEALFLAGAIPAFYYARRGRWPLVALPAAVAMGARAAGIFLLIGLFFEFLRGRDFKVDTILNGALALVVGALPLLAYGAYLNRIKGAPLYFLTDQKLGWGRELTNPIDSFLKTWHTWEGADYPTNFIYAWRIEILAAALGVGLTLWALLKREWGYAAYMGTTMAALMTSTWYFSIPRMLLGLFPAVVFLAAFTGRRPARHEYALLVLAPLATLGVVAFTRGAWFY